MEQISICILLLSMMVYKTMGADKMVTVGDVTAKVMETSGTIHIYTGNDDTNGVQVIHHFLKEIATEGSEADKFDAFNTMTFTFTEPEDVTFGANNVAAKKFMATGTATIEEVSVSYMITMYVFSADGTISVDGADVIVKQGDVKFDLKISNWPFCGVNDVTCTQEGGPNLIGQYLDLGLEVKGKDGTTPANKNGNVYDLGTDNKIVMPMKITIDDGAPQDQVTDYPKLETIDSKQVFTVRFNAFTTSAMYEPIVMTVSTNPGDGNNENPDDGNNENPDDTETMVSVSESGVEATVLKSSGRMTFTETESNKMLVVEFNEIKEWTTEGAEIDTAGHKYSTFENVVFTTSAVTEETLQNIDVKKMTFMTTLANEATLKVHLYLFKESGTITNGDETANVTAGTAKFALEITGWKFCGDTGVECMLEDFAMVASHLSVELAVAGDGTPTLQTTENAGNVYKLGKQTMILFTQYTKDGANTMTSMPSNYPSYAKDGVKELFVMKFEKFTTSLMYDPIVMMKDDSSAGATIHLSVMSVVMMLLVHTFRRFFN